MAIDLDVNLASWGELDELCLLACQDYNYGNKSDWFGAFRGGWYGMRMRVWGFQRHYFDSHNWIPRQGIRLEHEYHLSTMLFQMDSSIECMVYAANGLGNAISSIDFHDVTNRSALRKIAPNNVMERSKKNTGYVPGYETYFPRFTKLVRAHRLMVDVIMENHDVSKHRRMSMPSGKVRSDPPAGFFEAYGLTQGSPEAFFLSPVAELRLIEDPQMPSAEALTSPTGRVYIFERVAEVYAGFMSIAGDELFADACASVKLREAAFRT